MAMTQEIARRLREEEFRDALRYKFLRNAATKHDQVGTSSPYVVRGQSMETLDGRALDAAVDAEIAKLMAV